MANEYASLTIPVNADTRPLTEQVSRAATSAGDKASTEISSRLGRGLQRVAPVAGAVGKSVATGLGLATTAVVAFGVEAFKAASKTDAMSRTLDALAKANGLSAEKVQKTVGAVRGLGIEAGQAQGFVGSLVRGHIDLAHATDLARISQNLAASTGMDLSNVQGALTKAILSGNASALKRVGIVVDSTSAEKKLAAQLGTTVSGLTTAQKSQATLNAVMAAGKTVAGAYGAQLKTPQGALRLLKVDLANITETIGGPLVKALTPAFTGLAKLGASFSGALAPGGKLAPIVSAIGSTAARMLAPVSKLVPLFQHWFAGLNPATVNKIADAIKRFGPALLGLGGAAAVFTGSGLLKNLPIFGGMLGNLMGPLDLVKGGVLDLGKGMLTTLIPSLKGAVGEIGGLGKVLGAATGPIGIILTIFATLMAVSPQFRAAVIGLVKTLITALWPAFKAILAALKPLLPIITLLGKMLGQVLAPVLIALMPLLVSLTPLLVALAQVVGMLVTLVLDLLGPVLKVYVAFQKWYTFKILLPIIRVLVGVLTDLVSIITDVVKWIMGGSPGLIPAFRALQGIVTSVTKTITGIVVAGFTQIRDVIVSAWRFISSVTSNAWDTIRGVVSGAIRFVVSVVSNGMASARGLVARGMSAIVSTVRNIAGALGSAGRSAVLALLGGIRAQMAGIAGWVKGNIVDPVVNAVKSFFGIHSPSAVMAGLGKNVAEGFVSGIVKANPLTVAKKIFGGIPGALGAIVSKGLVAVGSLPGRALRLLGGLGGDIGGLLTKIPGLMGRLFGSGGGGGTGQYAGIMRAVLAHFGIPQLFGTFMAQMMTESGGNRFAVNNWDSNAAAGTPSKGLMQTIQPTFDAYAGPYRSRGIFDPLANIYAAVAYAISRYGGSISAVLGHGHGYATGGPIFEPVTGFGHRSGDLYQFGERGPEYVSPLTGPGAKLPGRAQPVVVNVYPQRGQSEVEIAAAVSRRLDWAAATGRA